MADGLEPSLVRDLTEAKAALARHGIVLIRSIETELEPAIMSEAKSSLASSPGRLAKLKDAELDALMAKLRKVSEKSVAELAAMYKRLLSDLGTEDLEELVGELDGIGQLFTWERISQVTEPPNAVLASEGFRPIALFSPGLVSDNFALELTQKWPPAFDRFRKLADQALASTKTQGPGGERPGREPKRKKTRKG